MNRGFCLRCRESSQWAFSSVVLVSYDQPYSPCHVETMVPRIEINSGKKKKATRHRKIIRNSKYPEKERADTLKWIGHFYYFFLGGKVHSFGLSYFVKSTFSHLRKPSFGKKSRISPLMLFLTYNRQNLKKQKQKTKNDEEKKKEKKTFGHARVQKQISQFRCSSLQFPWFKAFFLHLFPFSP